MVAVGLDALERLLIGLPGRRQLGEGRPAQDASLVVQIEEMPGIAGAVVHLACVLRAIGLARQLADVRGRVRGAQEGRNLFGQGLDRERPDGAVAIVFPGQRPPACTGRPGQGRRKGQRPAPAPASGHGAPAWPIPRACSTRLTQAATAG